MTSGPADAIVREVHYGFLETILECNFSPDDDFWDGLQGSTLLLAVISPCNTRNQDATKTLTSYRTSSRSRIVVVDLRTIQGVVGRVETRGRWGVVDRSEQTAKTVFHEENSEHV